MHTHTHTTRRRRRRRRTRRTNEGTRSISIISIISIIIIHIILLRAASSSPSINRFFFAAGSRQAAGWRHPSIGVVMDFINGCGGGVMKHLGVRSRFFLKYCQPLSDTTLLVVVYDRLGLNEHNKLIFFHAITVCMYCP